MTLLAGRYALDSLIGQGGMGHVYRAHDTKEDKPVAVKQLQLSGNPEDDARFRGWFQRELKALTLLDDEGVLRLLDHGEDAGTPFVVTELLQGADLDAIAKAGPLPEAIGLRIAERALGAIAAAHTLGIAHRDIKPSNIFLCDTGRVVMLDFGLARGLSNDVSRTMAQSFGTQVMGTPHYMAPEQLAGVQLSLRSDLFSFASTFFYLLSGRHAFAGAAVLDIVRAISKNQRHALRTVAPQLSEGVCLFLEKLMAAAPNDRPADAVAACDLLAPLVQERGASDEALQHFAARRAGGGGDYTATVALAASSPARGIRFNRRSVMWAVVIAGGIVWLGLAAVWMLRPKPAEVIAIVPELPAELPTVLPVPTAPMPPTPVATKSAAAKPKLKPARKPAKK